MAVICRELGYDLDKALNLTIPQVFIIMKNLNKIAKQENGDTASTEDQTKISTSGTEYVVKALKAATGRNKFTMNEILNPNETVRLHKQQQEKLAKK